MDMLLTLPAVPVSMLAPSSVKAQMGMSFFVSAGQSNVLQVYTVVFSLKSARLWLASVTHCFPGGMGHFWARTSRWSAL